jgi:HEAT repeat protein
MEIAEALKLLAHFDQGVRDRGMAALRAKGEAALPALLSALGHPIPSVRGGVALVLGQIGSLDAVVPLAKAVQDLAPGDDRTFCVRALTDLARPALDKEAWLIELFAHLTRDPDHFVRALACTALGRIGEHKAVPILDRARSDPEEWVREAATKALAALAAKPVPETPPPDEGKRSEALSALFSPDPVKRDLAAEEIARFGPSAAAAVAEAVEKARGEPPLQAVALLGRLGDRSARPLLLRIAADRQRTADVRTVALRALGRLCEGTEWEVLDFLLAERTADPLLRAAVASAVGSFRTVRAVRALCGHLEDAHVMVREAAGEALGRACTTGVHDLAPRLGAALRREMDAGVRARLIEALAAAGKAGVSIGGEAYDTGLELARRGLRAQGLTLLGIAGRRTVDAAGALLGGLSDLDLGVRLLACELLARCAPVGYAPAVEALRKLTGDANRDLSRAAILALGGVGGNDAAVTLRQLRSDTDPDVADAARAALERLGQGAEVIPLRR